MRKLEGDLGLAKETISDLENEKSQQEERLKKIENDHQLLHAKCEEESSAVIALQKKIKELTLKKEDLEGQLDNEQSAKIRAEKAQVEISAELEGEF